MTNNEKELLIKDLCARIPYLTKVNITNRESKNRIVELTEDNICHLTNNWWRECKPYLFPMSSMTSKQREEYESLCIKVTSECTEFYTGVTFTTDNFYDTIESFDYLYKNHIDVRRLINKRLAIDATNLNIY